MDDNRDVADTLAMLIAVMGHEVHRVYDGTSALLHAEAHRPDVILLDLGMPDMDGFSAAHHLRQNLNLEHTRLIAVTGHDDSASLEKARNGGFDDYLIKPYVTEELQDVLAGNPRPWMQERSSSASRPAH